MAPARRFPSSVLLLCCRNCGEDRHLAHAPQPLSDAAHRLHEVARSAKKARSPRDHATTRN